MRCRREPRSPAWGPEVPARGDSTQERLLALTGRDTADWPGAIWVAGSLIQVKPTAGDGGTASAVEIWEREGSGPPRHVHAEHDEMWYVLEGRFTFALGDREFQAAAGDVVVGPRGVPHTFRADTANSRLLDIHMPGGFERFFVQAGVPATELAPPAPAPAGGGPAVRAMIEAFGATVVGPPLGH
jgi:quercetin dioxygenase-like cupin family protein